MAQINKSSDYFQTKLYTGNGSTNNITGVGFQPDWVWLKHRNNSTAYNHRVYDVVRGATKNLAPNETDAEITSSTELTSFDSDGFTLGSGNAANQNTVNHVAWNWKAGGSASSNTDGSITSSVSANTTSGFSIVSYTGTGSALTCGHGLGAVPKMIIVKDRDASANWNTYHVGVGNAKTVQLNLTNAESATSSWNSTTPTSSVFSLGAVGAVNTSGNDYIAYCFAEKKGYSKFGSYAGNGGTDGTFVYTGFSPSWVMVRRVNTTGEFYILDNKRNTFNVADKYLQAQSGSAEGTFGFWDFCSNGFKIRGNTGGMNGSGDTYIYMAFAEAPLVGSNNIPSTAR